MYSQTTSPGPSVWTGNGSHGHSSCLAYNITLRSFHEQTIQAIESPVFMQNPLIPLIYCCNNNYTLIKLVVSWLRLPGSSLKVWELYCIVLNFIAFFHCIALYFLLCIALYFIALHCPKVSLLQVVWKLVKSSCVGGVGWCLNPVIV